MDTLKHPNRKCFVLSVYGFLCNHPTLGTMDQTVEIEAPDMVEAINVLTKLYSGVHVIGLQYQYILGKEGRA